MSFLLDPHCDKLETILTNLSNAQGFTQVDGCTWICLIHNYLTSYHDTIAPITNDFYCPNCRYQKLEDERQHREHQFHLQQIALENERRREERARN